MSSNPCTELGRVQNLCETTMVDCRGNLQIQRSDMPQFTTMESVGKVVEGLGSQWRCYQKELLYTEIKSGAVCVRPIQEELIGSIEEKLCNLYRTKCYRQRKDSVPVMMVWSGKEPTVRYILDGHHRTYAWLMSKERGVEAYKSLQVLGIVNRKSVTSQEAAKAMMEYLRRNHGELFTGSKHNSHRHR